MRKWKGLRCFGLLTLRGGAGFGSVTVGVWFGFPFPTKDKHFKCQPSEAKSLLWGWGQQCWVLR